MNFFKIFSVANEKCLGWNRENLFTTDFFKLGVVRDVVVRDVGFEFLHIEFWPRIRNTFGENPFLFLYITLVYLSGICLLNERSFRNHENPLCA